MRAEIYFSEKAFRKKKKKVKIFQNYKDMHNIS